MTRPNRKSANHVTRTLAIVFLTAAGCAQNSEQPVDQLQDTRQASETPQDIAVKNIRLYFVNGADGARSVTDIQAGERHPNVGRPVELSNERETVASAMTLPPGRFNQVNNFNFDLWGDASTGGTSSASASQAPTQSAGQEIQATLQLLLQAVAGLKTAVDQLGGLAREGGTASPTGGAKTQSTDLSRETDLSVVVPDPTTQPARSEVN